MQPLMYQPDDGLTASVDSQTPVADVCDRCAGEAPTQQSQVPGSDRHDSVVADDAERDPSGICGGQCRALAVVETPEAVSLAGRHWYVADDRLMGIEVTDISGDRRAVAVPFTVDGSDLFHYEDHNKVRLELSGVSTAAAMAGALAFLRVRYPSLRPAVDGEIPSAQYTIHGERLIVRFIEWIAATTAEVTDAGELANVR
jgi:hypothetical protein